MLADHTPRSTVLANSMPDRYAAVIGSRAYVLSCFASGPVRPRLPMRAIVPLPGSVRASHEQLPRASRLAPKTWPVNFTGTVRST